MDNKFYIPHKKDTPEVNFNIETGEFSVMGISHPENIAIFFAPLVEWLEEVKNAIASKKVVAPARINLTFFFIYINSASYKYLISLVDNIHDFVRYGAEIDVMWCYENGDEDMLNAGEELREYLNLGVNFEIAERNRSDEWDNSLA